MEIEGEQTTMLKELVTHWANGKEERTVRWLYELRQQVICDVDPLEEIAQVADEWNELLAYLNGGMRVKLKKWRAEKYPGLQQGSTRITDHEKGRDEQDLTLDDLGKQ